MTKDVIPRCINCNEESNLLCSKCKRCPNCHDGNEANTKEIIAYSAVGKALRDLVDILLFYHRGIRLKKLDPTAISPPDKIARELFEIAMKLCEGMTEDNVLSEKDAEKIIGREITPVIRIALSEMDIPIVATKSNLDTVKDFINNLKWEE